MAEIKTGIFAKNVQKRLNRAQEKVLQKLGKADETKDEQFEQVVINFRRQESEGARLQREMKAYMAAIKGMQQASINLTQSLHEVYEPDWHGKDDVLTIGKECDAFWEDFHNKLVDSTLLNLDAYLVQFPDLKTRVAKRSRKLIDYDSARHHVETLQASGMKNDRKMMKAEDELKKAQRVFDELNVGLQDELPTLWEGRVAFYLSTFKSVTSLEAKFHREISLVCRELYEVMTKLAEQHSDKMFTIQGAPSDSGPLRLARTPSPPEDDSPPESPEASSNHMLRPVSPGPPRPKSPIQLKKGPPVPPPPKATPTKEVAEEQIIDLFGGEFLPAPSPSQPNERPGESLLDLDFDAFQPDESVSPIPQTAVPWDMWSGESQAAQPAADGGFVADWSADFGSMSANGDAASGAEAPAAPGSPTAGPEAVQAEVESGAQSWPQAEGWQPGGDTTSPTQDSEAPAAEEEVSSWESQTNFNPRFSETAGDEDEAGQADSEGGVAGKEDRRKSTPGLIFTNEFGEEIEDSTEDRHDNWSRSPDGSGSEYETAEEWGDGGQGGGWVSADDELSHDHRSPVNASEEQGGGADYQTGASPEGGADNFEIQAHERQFSSEPQAMGAFDSDPFAETQGRGAFDSDPFAETQGRGAFDSDPFAETQGGGAFDSDPFAGTQAGGAFDVVPMVGTQTSVFDSVPPADAQTEGAFDMVSETETRVAGAFDSDPFAETQVGGMFDLVPEAEPQTAGAFDSDPFAETQGGGMFDSVPVAETQDGVGFEADPFAETKMQGAFDSDPFAETQGGAFDSDPFAETLGGVLESVPAAETQSEGVFDPVTTGETVGRGIFDVDPFAETKEGGAFDSDPFAETKEGGAFDSDPFAETKEGGAFDSDPFAETKEGGAFDSDPFAETKEGGAFDSDPFAETKERGAFDSDPFAEMKEGGAFDSDPFAKPESGDRGGGGFESDPFAETSGGGGTVTGSGWDADPFANSFPAASSGIEGPASSATSWQEASGSCGVDSSSVAQQNPASVCGTTAEGSKGVNIPRIHREPENSDMSEDEAANRRMGKLYQEIDTEKEEVTNAFNGFSQDAAGPSFFADFDKMNDANSESAAAPAASETPAEPAEEQDKASTPPAGGEATEPQLSPAAEEPEVAPAVGVEAEEAAAPPADKEEEPAEEPAALPAAEEDQEMTSDSPEEEKPAMPAGSPESEKSEVPAAEEPKSPPAQPIPSENMPIPSVVIEPASSNEGDDDRDADIISPTTVSDNGVMAASQPMKHMTPSGGVTGLPDDFLYKVETMHDFEAANDDELELKKGDLVLVVPTASAEDQDAGWLTGVKESEWLTLGVNAHRGLFPENFIQRLE